jgi:hypothetical protein
MSYVAQANTMATLNGLFKERYADKIERLIPDGAKLMKEIPFISRDKQPGNFYHQPVVLGLEHGVTFAADADGAFALNNAVPGQIKDATVRGFQLVLRSILSYSAAARAMGPGERAFEDATKFLVGNMLASVTKKLEIELLYGQVGYAVIASIASNVISIADTDWAPGIWAGAEQMPIDIYSSNLLTFRGTATVTAVSLENKTITINATPAGTVATDVIYHFGAQGKEFAGVHAILNNNTALFGIDASVYNLWKGSQFDASIASVPQLMSFAIVESAIEKGIEKGLDRDVTVMVNPAQWNALLTEQAAKRLYDSSYSDAELENGAKVLKFHGQNGIINLVPSIYVKGGFAYVMCMEDWVRVGSTDVTFKRPGQAGDNFFRDLENAAGYELRCYTDQALFCAKPGRSVLIKGLKTV